ncbi:hypothetical protein V2J09_022114, partial [Rumex salicifolius]
NALKEIKSQHFEKAEDSKDKPRTRLINQATVHTLGALAKLQVDPGRTGVAFWEEFTVEFNRTIEAAMSNADPPMGTNFEHFSAVEVVEDMDP